MSRKPFLSIGMPFYDDFNGVYFTTQALRMMHPEIKDQIELIFIDNNPGSKDSLTVKEFLGWIKDIPVKYVPLSEVKGTAIAKNKVFQNSEGDFVLCLDSHLLIEKGAINRLINFYRSNPNSKDLFSGPLIYDDLRNCSTHFKDIWRGEMWGIWDLDSRGDPYSSTYDDKPFEKLLS